MEKVLRGIIRGDKILYHVQKWDIRHGNSKIKGSSKFKKVYEEVFVDFENPKNFLILENSKFEFRLVEGKAVLETESTKYFTLNVDDIKEIVGRGTVLIISLKKNNFVQKPSERLFPFHIGDIILCRGKLYRVRGFELAKDLMFGLFNDVAGILVTEISD